MKKLILILLLVSTISSISFAQSKEQMPEIDGKEFSVLLEQLIEDMNIDSLFMYMMNSDMPQRFEQFMDTSGLKKFNSEDMPLLDIESLFGQFDSTDWNMMFDHSMKMFEQMDSKELQDLMNSFDPSKFNQMFKDLEGLDGMFDGFEFIDPNADSLKIKESKNIKEKKKLKRI
jgi:hypothetical protein